MKYSLDLAASIGLTISVMTNLIKKYSLVKLWRCNDRRRSRAFKIL